MSISRTNAKQLNQTITEVRIQLAGAAQEIRGERGLFVCLYLPDETKGVDTFRSRLAVPKDRPEISGNLAIRWALSWISASTKTVLEFSLPAAPDESLPQLDLYPRLDLISVPRDQNEAFRKLMVYTSKMKAY